MDIDGAVEPCVSFRSGRLGLENIQADRPAWEVTGSLGTGMLSFATQPGQIERFLADPACAGNPYTPRRPGAALRVQHLSFGPGRVGAAAVNWLIRK